MVRVAKMSAFLLLVLRVFMRPAAVCCAMLACGCADLADTSPPDAREKRARLQSTDDIGEYNPAEGKDVVSSDVEITNPVTGALEAYDPLKQQIAVDMIVAPAVRIFHATEGRYPESHQEFMKRVVKANSLRLPPLAVGKQYQYDVANHKLVVVKDSGQE